jgi:hypothetical protein
MRRLWIHLACLRFPLTPILAGSIKLPIPPQGGWSLVVYATLRHVHPWQRRVPRLPCPRCTDTGPKDVLPLCFSFDSR